MPTQMKKTQPSAEKLPERAVLELSLLPELEPFEQATGKGLEKLPKEKAFQVGFQ
jgi:hypothetical protein